jgi:hypothetical protein
MLSMSRLLRGCGATAGVRKGATTGSEKVFATAKLGDLVMLLTERSE